MPTPTNPEASLTKPPAPTLSVSVEALPNTTFPLAVTVVAVTAASVEVPVTLSAPEAEIAPPHPI